MTGPLDELDQPSNIRAVAAAAGVSKTTVSHVLSGKRPVAEATKDHVLKVMADLDFRPNFFAQALTSQRSQTIALLTQDITNPFYPALARGVQQALSQENHVLMLFDAGPGIGGISTFVDVAIHRRVDGVVVAVSDVETDLQRLRKAGIAVAAVGQGFPTIPLDWASADDELIGADAVRYLHSRGHRLIATIGGPSSIAPGSTRLRGYRKGMKEAGLAAPPAFETEGDWTREGGAAAMARLLDEVTPPSAVFCANDLMAIGALDTAFSRGVAVPDRLAIVGVDDIEAASLVRPALTTLRVEAHEIGRVAAGLLLRGMRGPPGRMAEHVLVPHRLVIRNSA